MNLQYLEQEDAFSAEKIMGIYHMGFLPFINLKPQMLVLPALCDSCWVVHCEGLG